MMSPTSTPAAKRKPDDETASPLKDYVTKDEMVNIISTMCSTITENQNAVLKKQEENQLALLTKQEENHSSVLQILANQQQQFAMLLDLVKNSQSNTQSPPPPTTSYASAAASSPVNNKPRNLKVDFEKSERYEKRNNLVFRNLREPPNAVFAGVDDATEDRNPDLALVRQAVYRAGGTPQNVIRSFRMGKASLQHPRLLKIICTDADVRQRLLCKRGVETMDDLYNSNSKYRSSGRFDLTDTQRQLQDKSFEFIDKLKSKFPSKLFVVRFMSSFEDPVIFSKNENDRSKFSPFADPSNSAEMNKLFESESQQSEGMDVVVSK